MLAKSNTVQEASNSDAESVMKIVDRVLQLEKSHLFQSNPHLNDEIMRIIKEEIK